MATSSATAIATVQYLDTPAARKLRGAVYTPAALADWLASLVFERLPAVSPRVADLGCGEGALISAVLSEKPAALCYGIDSNALAIARAKRETGRHVKYIASDMLSPEMAPDKDVVDHWLSRLDGPVDAVVMNPPWGAVHSLTPSVAAENGLTLAVGQYDTYDLFCELALKLISNGGAYGFILPDSILLPEHKKLRKLLLDETTITMVARLGEGIFPSVYCGCVIVSGLAKAPATGHVTECLRITKADRSTLSTKADFDLCRVNKAHKVPQTRFAEDAECRFDLDVTETDFAIAKIGKAGGDWTAPLISRRGAEISKSGKIVICDSCGAARPLPKGEAADCLSCAAAMPTPFSIRKIVSFAPPKSGGWAPLIVGEAVSRYRAKADRWLQTGHAGINYKLPTAVGKPRILVRKTGIGLNAALDSSGAFTNQVVFEYVADPTFDFPFSYLHYVLGVLNSRILFAFHLKRGGDLEWRSHPYVTQKTLSSLPIPVPNLGSPSWRQAAAIAKAVEKHLITGGRELEIEGLVAGLYNLDKSDVCWVSDVLENAADLQAMRDLRLASDERIRPVSVI